MTSGTVLRTIHRGTYKVISYRSEGKERNVLFSDKTPVATISSTDRSMITHGANVFARASKVMCDCEWEVDTIFVCTNEFRPPM